MFRLAQCAFRVSQQALKRPFITRTYLSDAYQAFDKWDESLSSEILQKTNISMYQKKLWLTINYLACDKKPTCYAVVCGEYKPRYTDNLHITIENSAPDKL